MSARGGAKPGIAHFSTSGARGHASAAARWARVLGVLPWTTSPLAACVCRTLLVIAEACPNFGCISASEWDCVLPTYCGCLWLSVVACASVVWRIDVGLLRVVHVCVFQCVFIFVCFVFFCPSSCFGVFVSVSCVSMLARWVKECTLGGTGRVLAQGFWC